MPFSKTDFYYDKELAAFFGEDICEFDEESGAYMGVDGMNFLHDRYRTWLMKVLIATGCDTIQKAIAKYPFIAEDTKREDFGDSDLDVSEEEEAETPAVVIRLDANSNKPKKATKRPFATIGAKKTTSKKKPTVTNGAVTHPERHLVNVFKAVHKSVTKAKN